MLRKCAVLVVTCLARRFTGHVGGLTSLLVGSLTYPNRMTAEAVTPDLRTGQWFHIERPPGAFVFHVRTLRKTSECAPGWLHLRAEEEDSAVLSGVAQGLTYVHMAPLQEQPIAPSQLDYSLPSTAVSCLRERLALLGVASLASSVLAAPQGNNAHTNPPPWSVLPLSSPHSPLLGDFSVVYQHMDTATIRDAAPKGKTGSKLAAMGLTANGEHVRVLFLFAVAEFDAAQWGHTTPFDFESPPIQPLEARVELQGAGQHLSLVTTVDSHSLSQPGHIAAVHYLDPSLLVDQDMFNRLHSDSMWRDALTFSDIERPLFEQPASIAQVLASIGKGQGHVLPFGVRYQLPAIQGPGAAYIRPPVLVSDCVSAPTLWEAMKLDLFTFVNRKSEEAPVWREVPVRFEMLVPSASFVSMVDGAFVIQVPRTSPEESVTAALITVIIAYGCAACVICTSWSRRRSQKSKDV